MQVVKKILERDLERHFSKECKRLKLVTVKLHLRFSTGWPDRVVVLDNSVLWVELKTITGLVSERQKAIHNILRQLNQKILILRTKEDITHALESASVSTKRG
jgi:hypothetical protein